MASTKTITVTNETVTIPAMTDRPDASQFSDGVSKLVDGINSNTQAIANTQSGLAYIVGNTNTTGSTLAVGQFVYVKGHSTITEGLRTVTASISANGNITTSNTSACSEGGLNALNSNITNYSTGTITRGSSVETGGTFQERCCWKKGGVACVSARIYGISISPVSALTLFQLPTGFRPKAVMYVLGSVEINDKTETHLLEINTDGTVYFSYSSSTTYTLSAIEFATTFPVA